MMQPVTDFAWRELAVLALFLWLLYRYTWLTLSVTLMAIGIAALIVLPVDLTFSLGSLAAIGTGLGLLAHQLQQQRAARQRQTRAPRSYTRPHDEFHT
ncbi:hypothetical protein MHZ90_01730 [Pantoea sp. ACRSH]|uniref:hypothetical protein n=1 Tax=unclassified Pantoea TaxID=2630326 RepID=UPI001EF611D8|nr:MULTISPECIES: hypothetical protein [unclassified Pantoea]MCG7364876.1 hypothetical protein [Pantoea sp. ACRSH]MCG7395248.1 hypothetical protein [Pantoea sp. ACRSC]